MKMIYNVGIVRAQRAHQKSLCAMIALTRTQKGSELYPDTEYMADTKK